MTISAEKLIKGLDRHYGPPAESHTAESPAETSTPSLYKIQQYGQSLHHYLNGQGTICRKPAILRKLAEYYKKSENAAVRENLKSQETFDRLTSQMFSKSDIVAETCEWAGLEPLTGTPHNPKDDQRPSKKRKSTTPEHKKAPTVQQRMSTRKNKPKVYID
jgi:hypothetical protein